MGVDMDMMVMRDDGAVVMKDMFMGRDSDWFEKLQMYSCEEIYDDFLPAFSGIPSFSPKELQRVYAEYEGEGFYGFHFMKVEDYLNWYDTYKPNIDAGWVSAYEKWKIERRHWKPEYLTRYRPEDAAPDDVFFVECEVLCHDTEIVEQIRDNEDVMRDKGRYWIVYYFTC